MSSRRLSLALLGVVTASLALGACASNSENEGSGPTGTVDNTVSANQGLAAKVPASLRKSGTLTVGVNVPYAPNEYLQGGKVVGFDVDLMDATAKVLNLKTSYRQADFDKIIPAVQGGTYDVGMSSFTDTKEREKSVDFVNYYTAGVLWASASGKKVNPLSACGLTVSVQTNTYEQTDELPALSKKCTSAGKQAIKIQPYESQDSAASAVTLGKAAAFSADSPVTLYAIKQSGGKLQQAGSLREAAPYGWALKQNSAMVSVMRQALQSLIADGTYLQICKKWGVQAGAIQQAGVNGATS